jgi:hypothetical protein
MILEILFVIALGIVLFAAAFFILWGLFNLADNLWTRWYAWRDGRKA